MADKGRTLAIEFAAKLDKMQTDVDRGLNKVVKKLEKMEKDGAKSFRKLESYGAQAANRIANSFSRLRNLALGYLSIQGARMFAGFVTSSLDAAAAIKDVGNAANASTRYVQELRYAGSQLGLEAEQIDEALTQLNKRLGDFRNTGAGAAAKAIETLGLKQKVLNGEFENTDEIMDEVIRRLSEVKSGTDRASLAAALFGKAAGPKMAEFLSSGEASVRAYREEANRLGLVMSDDLINAADDASDKLNALSQTISATATKAVADNADAIIELADAFKDALPHIVDGTRALLEWLGIIERTPERLQALIEKLIEARGEIANAGPALALVGGAADARIDSYRWQKMLAQFKQDVANPWDGSVEVVGKRRGKGIGAGTFDPDAAGADRLAKATADAAKKFRELETARRDWRNSIEEVGESRSAMERASDAVTRDMERAMAGGLDEYQRKAEEIERLADMERQAFTDAFVYALQSGDVKGAALGFINFFMERFQRDLANSIYDLISGAGGSGGKGGLLGSIFSAITGAVGGGGYSGGWSDIAKTWGRASGGPVSAGKPYIVGEKRPELFVPSMNGTILPSVPGGGGNMYVSIDARGATVDAVAGIKREMRALQAGFVDYQANEPKRVQSIVRAAGPRGQI